MVTAIGLWRGLPQTRKIACREASACRPTTDSPADETDLVEPNRLDRRFFQQAVGD